MKDEKGRERKRSIDYVVEEYGKLKESVEKAIRPSIKVKIHKPACVTDEEFKALENDPEFKKKVEDLAVSFVKSKRRGEER